MIYRWIERCLLSDKSYINYVRQKTINHQNMYMFLFSFLFFTASSLSKFCIVIILEFFRCPVWQSFLCISPDFLSLSIHLLLDTFNVLVSYFKDNWVGMSRDIVVPTNSIVFKTNVQILLGECSCKIQVDVSKTIVWVFHLARSFP